MSAGDGAFDPNESGPRVVHPVRVEVAEALTWVDRPLSAPLLWDVFEERHSLAVIDYHLLVLEREGAAAVVAEDEREGERQERHFVPAARLATG